MLWILMLVFVLAEGEPVRISVPIKDSFSCVRLGQKVAKAFPVFLETPLSDGSFTGMTWLCKGPNGELITDDK